MHDLDLLELSQRVNRIHRHSIWGAATNRATKQARRLPSLTVRASGAQKKGACIAPPGYDAGKKIKGRKRH
jgi:hypothetical protein